MGKDQGRTVGLAPQNRREMENQKGTLVDQGSTLQVPPQKPLFEHQYGIGGPVDFPQPSMSLSGRKELKELGTPAVWRCSNSVLFIKNWASLFREVF